MTSRFPVIHPPLSLRLRLTLWVGALLVACTVALTLFINLGTTLSARSGIVTTECGPVNRLTTPMYAKVMYRCASQSQAPLEPWVTQQARTLFVLEHMHAASLIGLAVVLILGIIGTYWAAGRVLRPVRRLSETAQAITVDSLDRRIALRGADDELKCLANAFDAMLDRLQEGIERERRFVSDASHEFRTPLAIMRTNLEIARADPKATVDELRETVGTVERSLRRLELLANDLLLLAAGEGDGPIDSISLQALITTLVAELEPEARAYDVHMRWGGDETVTVPGDYSLLRVAVRNLLDNAIRYNRRGGSVTATVGVQGSEAVVEIADTGPGIPPDQGRHIFERFYRVDRSRARERGGAGLGLALAAEIARRHEGSIDLQSEPGVGSVFTLRVPLERVVSDATPSHTTRQAS